MSPKFVGVGGRAGSGKDPAAQVLAGILPGDSVIIPVATGLKNMLAAHYGVLPGSPQAHRLFYTGEGKKKPSPNPLKPGNTVRQDLIDLGDLTRSLNKDVWIDDTLRRGTLSGAEYVVVPDVRYTNEASRMDILLWMGGDEAGDHPTEAELTSRHATGNLWFPQDTVAERLEALCRKQLDILDYLT